MSDSPKPRRRWRVTKADYEARLALAAQHFEAFEYHAARQIERADAAAHSAGRWKIICAALATALLVLAVWR